MFTRIKNFFLLCCLFVILVAMATVYKQQYANKLSHGTRVSISFHKMYSLLYLSQTVYLLYLLILGHLQATKNFKNPLGLKGLSKLSTPSTSMLMSLIVIGNASHRGNISYIFVGGNTGTTVLIT